MAFEVTPTSGTAPYTFTASYEDRLGFDLGLYITEFRTASASGSCPTGSAVSNNIADWASELLNTGTLVVDTNVPNGSCRRHVNLIRRVSDGVVVASKVINIDNTV